MAITINDVDAGAQDVQITLSVSHGTLTRDPGAPGPFTTITGNGTGSLTIVGSLTNVNDAIDPLTYQPGANYNGPDTLSVFVSDLGHTGAGGPLTATDSIGITVRAVNDALPDGTVLLVGPQDDPDPELFRLSRVRSLPPVPFADLPSLAAASSVLVMPYADLPVTRAMQPLKLKE